MNGYLKIENKGEVDINAFRLMGASTKEGDSTKIGYYGSGIKYAIASALRLGIPVKVFSGKKEIKITTRKTKMSGQAFDVICINNSPTSITTRMGKDWKPWFIFREFYCNAVDEGDMKMGVSNELDGESGKTIVYIGMTENISGIMNDFNKYFSEKRTPFHSELGIKVFPRISEKMSVYRKGILVFNEHSSIYDYDFPDMDINESREASDFDCTWAIVDFWKHHASKDMILSLCNNTGEFEFNMTWGYGSSFTVNRQWVEALNSKIIIPQEYSGNFVDDLSSDHVMLPYKLCEFLHRSFSDVLKIRGFSNGKKERVILQQSDKQAQYITHAISFLKRAGLSEIENYPVRVSVLEKSVLGEAFEGQIFLSPDLFEHGRRRVIETMLEEFVHNKSNEGDRTRGMQDYLINMIVGSYENKLNEYL